MNTQTKTVNPFMAVLAIDAVLAESTPTPRVKGTVDTTPRTAESRDHKRALTAARVRKHREALRAKLVDKARELIHDAAYGVRDKDGKQLVPGCTLENDQAIFKAATLVEGCVTTPREVKPGTILPDTYVPGVIRYTRTAQEVMDTVNHRFKGFSKPQGKTHGLPAVMAEFTFSPARRRVNDYGPFANSTTPTPTKRTADIDQITQNELAYRNMNRAERSKANPLLSVRVLDRAENLHYSKVWFNAACPTDRTNGPLTATERLDVSRARPVAGANVPVPAMGYAPVKRDVLVRQSDGSQCIERSTIHTATYAVDKATEIKSAYVTMAQVGQYPAVGVSKKQKLDSEARAELARVSKHGLEIRCSVANGRRVFISHV